MQPGGDKFVKLLCLLASHVMSKDLMNCQMIKPHNVNTKPGRTNINLLRLLKGFLSVAQDDWINLNESYLSEYSEFKELARYLHIYFE